MQSLSCLGCPAVPMKRGGQLGRYATILRRRPSRRTQSPTLKVIFWVCRWSTRRGHSPCVGDRVPSRRFAVFDSEHPIGEAFLMGFIPGESIRSDGSRMTPSKQLASISPTNAGRRWQVSMPSTADNCQTALAHLGQSLRRSNGRSACMPSAIFHRSCSSVLTG